MGWLSTLAAIGYVGLRQEASTDLSEEGEWN